MDAKAPLARCGDCPLRDRPLVAGYGPRRTDRVILGEAPGEAEVALGRPFVGKAGRRLDEAFSASGVDRSTVYITNTFSVTRRGTNPLLRVKRSRPVTNG